MKGVNDGRFRNDATSAQVSASMALVRPRGTPMSGAWGQERRSCAGLKYALFNTLKRLAATLRCHVCNGCKEIYKLLNAADPCMVCNPLSTLKSLDFCVNQERMFGRSDHL